MYLLDVRRCLCPSLLVYNIHSLIFVVAEMVFVSVADLVFSATKK